MIIQPLLIHIRMMNLPVIKIQIDFSDCVFDNSLFVFDKCISVHDASIDQEANFSLIGKRRDQIGSSTLCHRPNWMSDNAGPTQDSDCLDSVRAKTVKL